MSESDPKASDPKVKVSIDLEAACAELPIFPLPQVVLFPRALLPLHVFEPRYRQMLKDCMHSHKAMAVALVAEDGPASGPRSGPLSDRGDRRPAIATVAGLGVIVEHHELADGRSNILLHGHSRVRLEELPYVTPYRRARATVLHEVHTHVPDADRQALTAAVSSFVADVGKRDPKFSFNVPRSLEVGAVADLCAHHLVLDARARQAILEELDVLERVRRVITELSSQHVAMIRGAGGSLN